MEQIEFIPHLAGLDDRAKLVYRCQAYCTPGMPHAHYYGVPIMFKDYINQQSVWTPMEICRDGKIRDCSLCGWGCFAKSLIAVSGYVKSCKFGTWFMTSYAQAGFISAYRRQLIKHSSVWGLMPTAMFHSLLGCKCSNNCVPNTCYWTLSLVDAMQIWWGFDCYAMCTQSWREWAFVWYSR